MNPILSLSKLLIYTLTLFLLLGGAGLTVWTATASAASPAVADPETVYIVQRGDTLFSIARRYGVTVDALMAYNSLSSTTIYVGQRLLIPTGQVPGPGQPVSHIVQRGETLYSIARRYGVTVDALVAANRLTSTSIYVGQRLVIPASTPPEKPPVTHVVQRGETLYSIARRYGSTVAAIQAANRLTSTTIYVGQRLLIPTGQGNPTPSPPPGNGQRLQFAPGATSATVAGRTTPAAPQRYVVRAQGGQTLTVSLETRGEASYIAVLNPRGENMAGAGGPIHQWSGTLPTTGDYTIEVRATGAAPADFRLTVTIPPAGGPSPTPSPISESGEATTQSTVSTVTP
jgi:LysM repeat protein